MQTTTVTSVDDESMHPLWLGMLMLFSIVLLIGTLCCLRVKCYSQFHHLFRRKTEDTSLNVHSPPPKEQSPRLYTLVNHLRRKQFAIRQQRDEEENTSLEFDHVPQISISSTLETNRNSEIARKFYASLRDTSQCRNSSSFDSYHNDVQHPLNPSSLKPSRQGQMKFFRTAKFFKSIPNQDDLTL